MKQISMKIRPKKYSKIRSYDYGQEKEKTGEKRE